MEHSLEIKLTDDFTPWNEDNVHDLTWFVMLVFWFLFFLISCFLLFRETDNFIFFIFYLGKVKNYMHANYMS